MCALWRVASLAFYGCFKVNGRVVVVVVVVVLVVFVVFVVVVVVVVVVVIDFILLLFRRGELLYVAQKLKTPS